MKVKGDTMDKIQFYLEYMFEKIFSSIEENLSKCDCDYKTLFKEYIIKKFTPMLSNFLCSENEEFVKRVVEREIDWETKKWNKYSVDGMMSLLIEDAEFINLLMVTNSIFNLAVDCNKKGIKLSDENEYANYLKKLSDCIDGIKSFNVDAARAMLGDAMLELDYAFGKTELMSLRLSHVAISK